MMAVEYINNDTPLIISNADQLFDMCLDEVINSFENGDYIQDVRLDNENGKKTYK